MSKLFIFSHYNEGICFIEQMEFEKMDNDLNMEIFYSQQHNDYLLICGENKYKIVRQLSIFIEWKKTEIQQIWNIGVCGALNRELNKREVLDIRTVYGYEHEPMFKSYTTIERDATVDLMSYHSRLKDKNKALELSYFAHVVDREGYYVAMMAKEYAIHLRVIKIVSDHCFDSDEIDIQDEDYSYELYDYYKKNEKKNDLTTMTARDNIYENSLYMTVSQRNLLKKYGEILHREKNMSIDDVLKLENIKIILNKDIARKEKTKLIIEYIEEMIDPLKKIFNEKLKMVVENLQKDEIELKINPYNKKKNKISFLMKDKMDFDLKLKKLSSFDFNLYENIYSGDV